MEPEKDNINGMEPDAEPVQETVPEPEAAPVQETVPEPAAAPAQDSAEKTEMPQVQQTAEAQTVNKSFLRACGSWTDIFLIAGLLSVIMILMGSVVSAVLTHTVLPARQFALNLLGDAGSVEFLMQYFDFFGIWIVFMIVITLFKDNRPMWKAFFYNGHGNNLKAILAGILLGFGMNGFCILMSCINGDIKLAFNEFRPAVFFIFLFCVMIQSGAEEIVDRCYLYQKLRRRYRWPVIAVLVNALIFMSLHMGNPGVTKLGLLQVFLIGVLFSLIVYYWDSLWTVIWAHTAWNFSQSIVFGLPNSGIVSSYSVFKLEAASARDGIFYNTSFGVEGSLGANVMIGAVIVIILIYGLATKRGERKDYWYELEQQDAGRKHIWEAVVLTVIMLAILAAFIGGSYWLNNHSEEEVTQQIETILEEQAQQELLEQQQQQEQEQQAPAGNQQAPAVDQQAPATGAVEEQTPADGQTPATGAVEEQTPATGAVEEQAPADGQTPATGAVEEQTPAEQGAPAEEQQETPATGAEEEQVPAEQAPFEQNNV